MSQKLHSVSPKYIYIYMFLFSTISTIFLIMPNCVFFLKAGFLIIFLISQIQQVDKIVHDTGAEPVFPAQNSLFCDEHTQNSLRISNHASSFHYNSGINIFIQNLP